MTLNPAVLVGKPTIRGLRIGVGQVVRALANGVADRELLADYPDDLLACLAYSADLIAAERVYRIPVEA